MAHTTIETKQVGGSVMIRVPKEILKAEQIGVGELIDVEIKKLKKDYFGAIPDLTPFTKSDRMRSRYD